MPTYTNPIADTSTEVLRIPIPVILSDLAGNGYTLSGGGIPFTPTGGISLVNTANTGLAAAIPAIVQKTNAVSTGSVTTLAKAFTNANTAGNTIVVVAASGSNTAMTVADSQSNTYTSAVSVAQSTTVGLAIFYAVNVAGGVNTVTLTCASSSAAIEIYEVSGVLGQTLGVLGQTSSGSSASGATATTSNIAGPPNSLAFMGVGIGTAAQNITVTTSTNWTADAGTNGLVTGGTPSGLFQFNSFSQFLPTLRPVLPTATIGSAEPYAIVSAVFKPVALGIQGTVGIEGYNYTNITTNTTTVVKTGFGLLHAITVNTAPTATGTLTIYDNTTNSNPKIGTITGNTATSLPAYTVVYDVSFSTGLTIVTATNAGDYTIVWR